MKIGGLLKFTMIDFPGKISAIVFTQGCNLNCRYCHNPELIAPASVSDGAYAVEDVLFYLEKRRGVLEGLVITGGEPLLQPGLKGFIAKVKALGYLVKLDTNGTNPAALKELVDGGLLDYVAMDIKAPAEKYEAVCGAPVNLHDIKASVDILIAAGRAGLKYEFRTTYDKTILNDADIDALKRIFPGLKVQDCNPVAAKDILKVNQ